MFVLKEKQEYVDNYITQIYKGIEADRLYYAGHHPEYEVGNLEGLLYSVGLEGVMKFASVEDAESTINQHGMGNIFEIVEI